MKKFLLLSGKRCVGKNFIASKFQKNLENSVVVNLADQVKLEYSKKHSLSYHKLCMDREYKEIYRPQIIQYGTEQRKIDPDVWCKKLEKCIDQYEHIIIADIRYPNEIKYFTDKYSAVSVRIEASNEVRENRGWIKDAKIDEHETETLLDDYTFDFVYDNSDQ